MKKTILFVALFSFSALAQEAEKSACIVKTNDPFIAKFYRGAGLASDPSEGNFQVEINVECDAVDIKKDGPLRTEKHETKVTINVFNMFEKEKTIYFTESISEKTEPLEGEGLTVNCVDTKSLKTKLLKNTLKTISDINCEEEDE